MTTEKKATTEIQVLAPRIPKTMADDVLNRLSLLKDRREINLPASYSPANALQSAWLTILETVDRNKKPALDVCSKESVANALLKMCIQGLSPTKAQCYFVVHGNVLTMMRSYQGTKAVAKRVAGIKDVLPAIIYEGDVFEYEFDITTGRQKITKHTQKLENINPSKIKGAYAIVIEADGSLKAEIMTFEQIQKAWQQGYPGDAHKNFPDQMAKKTVTYRACKDYINSSNDADLFSDGDEDADNVVITVAEEIKENGNKTQLQMNADKPELPEKKVEKKEPSKDENKTVPIKKNKEELDPTQEEIKF